MTKRKKENTKPLHETERTQKTTQMKNQMKPQMGKFEELSAKFEEFRLRPGNLPIRISFAWQDR